jgi:hypothetical protein
MNNWILEVVRGAQAGSEIDNMHRSASFRNNGKLALELPFSDIDRYLTFHIRLVKVNAKLERHE